MPEERKNYCFIHSEKLNSVKDVHMVLNEQQGRRSARADTTLTHLNTTSGSYEEAKAVYDDLLAKVPRCASTGELRKNAVYGLNFVVHASLDFEGSEAYYAEAREFIAKRYGKIVGWAIHRDETQVHMQVVTIPLDEKGHLNARKLIGGTKHRQREMQNSFYAEVGKKYGLARGELVESPQKHKTVEEFHRQREQKLAKREARIDNKAQAIVERASEIVQEGAYKVPLMPWRSKELRAQALAANEQNAILTTENQKKSRRIKNLKNQLDESTKKIELAKESQEQKDRAIINQLQQQKNQLQKENDTLKQYDIRNLTTEQLVQLINNRQKQLNQRSKIRDELGR